MDEQSAITLILTHGRDQPFQEPESEQAEWEREVRWGLKRLKPSYTKPVSMEFAFYGDIWRPDAGDVGLESGDTRGLGDDALDDTVMEALATDMVTALGEPPATLERGLDWDLLAGMISALDQHFHVGEAILRLFLKDLTEYLTQQDLRQRVVDRVAGTIAEAGRPVALLAHSMGTVVGYDVLMRRPDLPVRAFVTFGSVLGFPTTRRFVADAKGKTPFPPSLPRWINVYNRKDFATVVRELATLYTSTDGRRVEDHEALGADPSLLDPMAGHRPTVYLSSATMAKAIRSVLSG